LISIVVPTYNERENLPELIGRLHNVIQDEFEIVIVDDNSPDGTADVAKKLNKLYKNVRVFIRDEKTGVGSAYYFGYRKARGDIVIGMDADLSHNPDEIPKLLEKINDGYDLVLGSRHIKGSYYERREIETKRKYIISKYGNMLTSLILNIPIHDFTNGFRAFKKDVLGNIWLKNMGNSLLMEFIAKAYWKNYKVVEVPTTFVEREKGYSKLKLTKEPFNFIIDVVKLKLLSCCIK